MLGWYEWDGKSQRIGVEVEMMSLLSRLLGNFPADPPYGETYALVYSSSLGSTTFPGLGTFDLALPITIVYTAVIPPSGLLSVSIPINDPGLVGFKAYLQSIMDDRAGATGKILFSLVEKLEVHP